MSAYVYQMGVSLVEAAEAKRLHAAALAALEQA